MKNEQIIKTIKDTYSRDIRKQLVKTLIKDEKSANIEDIESSYKIINQIFSYVISELGWTFAENSTSWDDTPLKIILETFPKIDETKWFEEKLLSVTKAVRLEGGF
ncbi:MAG: hypothetical protein OQJ77_00675 [Thiovulaceae bacterium]|nr:hypothetical protein [Sulfurimonadaceae bacterium]MCW9025802.1 hypothetical protein [Sulfurimonadaceae bacterium]